MGAFICPHTSAPSMGTWSRFWAWYENKVLGSIVIIAIIQFIQIPHMVWNADLYLELGTVSRLHPALDWLLYGVDLIEIVSIVNVGMIMYSMLKKKRAGGHESKSAKALMDEKVCRIMKQAIVVRTDLDMGKGKIAAQVGHACVMGALAVKASRPDWFREWMGAQAKIVLKVDSLEELELIKDHARAKMLPCSEVSDAGHTQLEPGTITCVSIGPAPDGELDAITGKLKLL